MQNLKCRLKPDAQALTFISDTKDESQEFQGRRGFLDYYGEKLELLVRTTMQCP